MKQESPPPSTFYLENVFLAWVVIGTGLLLSGLGFVIENTVQRSAKEYADSTMHYLGIAKQNK